MVLGVLAATAGVPWLHGADGTHAHHATATDACRAGGHCHGHGDRHDDGVGAQDRANTPTDGHRHDDHDGSGEQNDAPPEEGPTEHDGSCVTCVQLHLLTCTPPAADADRAPSPSCAGWAQVATGEFMAPASRRVLPPSRGPPRERVS
jgi:hypothetical protein